MESSITYQSIKSLQAQLKDEYTIIALLTTQVELGDPGCNAAGGYRPLAADQDETYTDGQGQDVTVDLLGYRGRCLFNYAYFDNVQERQTNSQLWMEFNVKKRTT